MSTLSQFGRGGVLLCSMTLVACYINKYATGYFPWEPAATAATIAPPEFPEMLNTSQPIRDPAIQQASYPEQRPVFLPGSKSVVAGSTVVGFEPAMTTLTAITVPTTTAGTNPVFMSGSKSFSGSTTILSGSLTSDSKPGTSLPSPQMFLGGSKTLHMPPPQMSSLRAPTPQQFMSGSKSMGPAMLPGAAIPAPPPLTIQTGSKLQGYPTTMPPPSYVPPANGPPSYDKPVNPSPVFMSGSKSPFGSPPTTMKVVPQFAPNQQAAPPLQITPQAAPVSPAGKY